MGYLSHCCPFCKHHLHLQIALVHCYSSSSTKEPSVIFKDSPQVLICKNFLNHKFRSTKFMYKKAVKMLSKMNNGWDLNGEPLMTEAHLTSTRVLWCFWE